MGQSFNDASIIDFPHTQVTQEGLFTEPVPCDQINTSEHLLENNLGLEAVSEKDNNNDFLHPIISNNENLLSIISDKNSSDTVFIEPKINKIDDINWDDMLDSELFVKNTAGGETDCKELDEDHNIINSTISMESAFIPRRVSDVGKENKYKKKSKNTKSNVSDLSAKVRKYNNNAETSNPKVMVEMKRTNKKHLRKQKYTKAVKNWLDNVESPHLVCANADKECINELKTKCGTKDDVLRNPEPNKHLNKMCDTPDKEMDSDKAQSAMRTAKKVVQAQLANKDGIMKFSKPKITDKRVDGESVSRQSTSKDNRNKKINKFVVPIKSQTAEVVKFQVHSVDEENIVSYNDSLLQAKDKEIIAVLIYSNGFCQLNSHYTNDACSPSGIIICHNAMFYCFQTPGPNLKKALSYLLKNNIVVCYDARSVLMYLGSHLELDISAVEMRDAKASHIGATLLDPDNPPENFSALQRLLALSSVSASVTSTECSLQKSSWYMSQLKECWLKLLDMLKENSLWDVFIEIEMKVLPIITAMELRGVCVDIETLNSMEQAVVDRLKAVEARCHKVAGRVFQVSSPAQVRALLYDELRLDDQCNLTVRGTVAKGAKSTSETTLRRLAAVSAHELPRLVLEYRHLHKAHATFLAGIAQHVRHGVVRPTWVQMASATGRIAASNPNLQAIPKAPFSLFLFPGADDERAWPALHLRACYVARPGRCLLAADFRHVECRVFAHLAADAGLLRALAQPGDFFTQLTADWLKKPESEVVAEERERTKRLVYASLYGAGPRKLMEILGVSYQRALQVAASFHRTFPSLKEFGATVWRRCVAERGRVRSLRGRLRVLPAAACPASPADRAASPADLAASPTDLAASPADCAQAQRQALNFVVQGSAADVCKTAMVATARELDAADAALVLQLHDELVWDVDERRLHHVAGHCAPCVV
ncbi:hypothetical protein SFRURICE_014765 [Spodoptera frugiperda]|nr:hypothetical protein SFRURICE_014765 [Spodoptera frugiperda]